MLRGPYPLPEERVKGAEIRDDPFGVSWIEIFMLKKSNPVRRPGKKK